MPGKINYLFGTGIAGILLAQTASLALAGPLDVWQTAPEPEQMGTLAPDQILTLPAPRAEVSPPPPPPPHVTIESASGISISEPTNLADSVGLISPEQAQFLPYSWQYLTIDEAQALLSPLPAYPSSLFLSAALERLLLMQAEPPQGHVSGWVTLRAEALGQIGATHRAAELLAQVPENLRDPALNAALVRYQFIAGQPHNGCAAASKLPPEDAAAPLLPIFCDAIEGRFSEAELAISIREEEGNPLPEWFVSLVESLHYPDSRISPPQQDLSPLEQVMILSAGDERLPEALSLHSYSQPAFAAFHQLIGENNAYSLLARLPFLEERGAHGYGFSPLLEAYRQLAGEAKPAMTHVSWARASSRDALIKSPNAKTVSAALAAFADKPGLALFALAEPLKLASKQISAASLSETDARRAYIISLLAGNGDAAQRYMALLETKAGDAIATHLAFELHRFTFTPLSDVSSAAKQLPPYTIPANSSAEQLELLGLYYRLLPLFDLQPPELTLQIMQEMGYQETPSNPPPLLNDYAQKGSAAGVLLFATAELGNEALAKAPAELIEAITGALIRSGQTPLAKQFAMEALALRMW